MRLLLQLVVLSLLATVARADIFSTGSATLYGPPDFSVLYHTDNACNAILNATVEAFCSPAADYGSVSLGLRDAGDGPDCCLGTKGYGASNHATVGFRDSIVFYGPPGETAVVGWFGRADSADTISVEADLPFAVTFNVPHSLSATLDGSLLVFGNDTLGREADYQIFGFEVFKTSDPGCAFFTPDTTFTLIHPAALPST